MKIVIAGGTGFIGQALVKHFRAANHQCVVLGRSHEKIKKIFGNTVKAITQKQVLTEGAAEIKTADLLINLAGASIGDKRWSKKRKREILDSRLLPTQRLTAICASLGKNSPPLFNASAIGIYGLQPVTGNVLPTALDERTNIDFNSAPDFLSQVARAWELATQPAKEAGVRVVNLRFGVVLGKNGGVLKKLKLPFLFFIGGPIGSGQQPFSWVAMEDLLRAVDFLFAKPEISGPVNIVAPNCVTQKQLAQALGKVLHRPSFISTPAFILQSLYGEMAKELLLSGQNVYPHILLEKGFQFRYPDITSALRTSI